MIGLAGTIPAIGLAAQSQDTREELSTVPQVANTADQAPSRIEATQIEEARATDAYWPETLQTAPDRTIQQNQASPPDSSNEAPQISSVADSERSIAQLNVGDLEGTLSQLTIAERQVLLDAIQGTDICDNPPEIAAVIELCQTRIETRSSEFATREANSLSAEERLLGENLDRTRTASTLDRDVERLARNAGRGDVNSLDTQAIASVALGTPQPALPEQSGGTQLSDLPADTQALINALVQQLGGATGGPPQ